MASRRRLWQRRLEDYEVLSWPADLRCRQHAVLGRAGVACVEAATMRRDQVLLVVFGLVLWALVIMLLAGEIRP